MAITTTLLARGYKPNKDGTIDTRMAWVKVRFLDPDAGIDSIEENFGDAFDLAQWIEIRKGSLANASTTKSSVDALTIGQDLDSLQKVEASQEQIYARAVLRVQRLTAALNLGVGPTQKEVDEAKAAAAALYAPSFIS